MTRIREFFSLLRGYILVPERLAIAFCVAIFLAFSGPFGTYDEMGFPERLAYWSGVVALSVLLVNASRALVKVFIASRGPVSTALWDSAISAIILAPIVFVYSTALFGGKTDDLPSMAAAAAIVFFIVLFVTAIRVFFGETTKLQKPRLFARLAAKDAEEIYRISVRDHYVDVFTDRGLETLLMRFSDALAELDGFPGHRVHRSHWVSDDAIRGYHKRNGRAFVVLHDGSEVPVSRGYRAEVETELLNERRTREKPVLVVQS